jgi:hypothetical protein
MVNDPYHRKNLEQRIINDADQTEYSAIIKESVLIDEGLYDDKVSGAMDDFDINDSGMPHWQVQDLQYDTATGEVHKEIMRRADLLGDAYPFKIEKNQLLYNGGKSQFYEFCLAISRAPDITSGDNVNLPRYFERICALLVKLYLGHSSDCIHVGTPRDRKIGSTFFEAMKKIHLVTQEWVWDAITDFGNAPQTTGDEGLDFIAWKDTPDKRKGKLFIIGQCACGDDWKNKFNDLTLPKLKKWFHPLSYVDPPVRAFAVPHHLSEMNLTNAQNEAGLVFDRARLSIIAEAFSNDSELVKWKPKMENLIKYVIK